MHHFQRVVQVNAHFCGSLKGRHLALIRRRNNRGSSIPNGCCFVAACYLLNAVCYLLHALAFEHSDIDRILHFGICPVVDFRRVCKCVLPFSIEFHRISGHNLLQGIIINQAEANRAFQPFFNLVRFPVRVFCKYLRSGAVNV